MTMLRWSAEYRNRVLRRLSRGVLKEFLTIEKDYLVVMTTPCESGVRLFSLDWKSVPQFRFNPTPILY